MNFRWPRTNAAPRTLREALAIAAANGVTLPDGVDVRVMPASFFANDQQEWACYAKIDAARVTRVSLSDLQTRSGVIMIKLHEAILTSDEAIVEILGHECYEITELLVLFAQSETMSASRFAFLVDPNVPGAIHVNADRYAKALVKKMRGDT